jgi:site-specific DNA-methyltransferase (adenine-specific)
MNIVHLGDCMDGLKDKPDGYYDLAVCDPPYGIGMDLDLSTKLAKHGFKEHNKGATSFFDSMPPDETYFKELFRVSKEQIIWGANHFIDKINRPFTCFLIWNKVQRGFSFADAEMAWTSFSSAARVFDYARGNDSGFAPKLKGIDRVGINIHPTQKPVSLYQWIFKNYAKEGMKILDTHVGSGSSRIAADKAGLSFEGWELDADYHAAQEKRYRLFKQQLRLDYSIDL